MDLFGIVLSHENNKRSMELQMDWFYTLPRVLYVLALIKLKYLKSWNLLLCLVLQHMGNNKYLPYFTLHLGSHPCSIFYTCSMTTNSIFTQT